MVRVSTITRELEHPIDDDGDKAITKVTLRRPTVRDSGDLALIFGGERIAEIIKEFIGMVTEIDGERVDEKAVVEALKDGRVDKLLKGLASLVNAETLDAAFALLGRMTGIGDKAEKMAPEDLVGLLSEAIPVFFPNLFGPSFSTDETVGEA